MRKCGDSKAINIFHAERAGAIAQAMQFNSEVISRQKWRGESSYSLARYVRERDGARKADVNRIF